MSRIISDRVAGAIAAVLLVLGLAAGFWLNGSPTHLRSIAQDEQRQSDLSTIVRAVRELPVAPPNALSIAPTRSDGSSALADPVSKVPYHYERLSVSTFRLCATFDAPADPTRETQWAYVPQVAYHHAGHQCFTFRVMRGRF